ncbi:hypothetical protein [Pokkaliibacter plantistimulans]|uniref:hypothetical protein n=1 Tax=Pokkaliibacter plantistimulans TaxID=1635171 RepID=UPI0011B04BBB|nr:hypothetical protein [Pokkaliibacter plantistimulans]
MIGAPFLIIISKYLVIDAARLYHAAACNSFSSHQISSQSLSPIGNGNLVAALNTLELLKNNHLYVRHVMGKNHLPFQPILHTSPFTDGCSRFYGALGVYAASTLCVLQ